ncbi:DUF6248 family natural product biosynthesis protein [Nocardiopsis sp. NPDC006139]|uniref:DUF6248 family natural product biosynthesis protein n=1 Tax=Nocardiopsis sp. NPDC006139 TaxID=3154578 RepID=UPI0033B30C71
MSTPPPPMTAETAAWIREHAHRPQHGRRLMQPRLMGQAGCLHLATPQCSECRVGCHRSCTGTSWPRLAETWILDSHGSSLYWEDLPHLVWTPPRPCACACRTTPTPDAAPSPDAAVCACQWGPTGHCGAGAHHQCVARVVETCETYLTTRSGACILDAGVPVPVWLADRVCRWACPCDCHTSAPARTVQAADPAPAAAAPGEPVQVALF